MKILFIYTDVNVRGGAKSYQFGIGVISAVLKARGHDTKLHYMFGKYETESVRKAIESYSPDIIAFSAVSPQYTVVRKLVKDLKPFKAFTIFGGQHATLVPDCLEEMEGLNAICVGEGEYAMAELADSLEKGNSIYDIKNLHIRQEDGSIVRNPTRPFIEDLDKLPFVDREIFDYQGIIDSDFHTALFMFSRGCPYDCTFCSNHALRSKQAGKYVRFRSVDSSMDEIRQVVSSYNVKSLYFNDDCFTVKKSFVEEFCARYRTEFNYPFDINARPETLNDDICKMLAEAGCRRVSIGIENGSEKFRREVLNRKQSNDVIAAAFECCRKYGLRTKSFNILGFPYETPEIFQETIDLNARIQPDSVIIGIFEPYPGTRLAETCEKERFIDGVRKDEDFVGRTDTILNMPLFPRKQILKCFRNFAYNVYKGKSLPKALFYKVYYSPWGEPIIRVLSPVKDFLRRFIMGV
ncbi:B12-binding domain-containing radical SAM protein [Verrucomicrobiota bacterium]